MTLELERTTVAQEARIGRLVIYAIAVSHFNEDSAQLAEGEALQADRPIAYITGASNPADDLTRMGIPDPNVDADILEETIASQYRALIEEEGSP